MQTPRGALAPEFRSSGRPTKWGDRQQHRSDWDDSPAAVRTLPGTLRSSLFLSPQTYFPGAAWLSVGSPSGHGGFSRGARGGGWTRGGVGGLWAKGQSRVLALLSDPTGVNPTGFVDALPPMRVF